MRDEMDARFWVSNHDSFADAIDEVVKTVRSGFGRLAEWDGTTHQLLALAVSFFVTAVTFSATATATVI